MPDAKSTHKLIGTPNPKEFAMAVTADDDILWSLPDLTQPEGVFYKDFPEGMIEKSRLEKYGTYRYFENRTGPDGKVIFIFVKSKTDAERNAPYRTIWSQDDKYWGPVVEWLDLYRAAIVSRLNGSLSSYQFGHKRGYRPAVEEGSKFKEEYFLSDVPWDFTHLRTDCPQLSEVVLSPYGVSFPKAYHPEIETLAFASANAQILNWELIGTFGPTDRQTNDDPYSQHYPATNHPTRKAYVMRRKQTVSVGYELLKVTVYPPPLNPITEG